MSSCFSSWYNALTKYVLVVVVVVMECWLSRPIHDHYRKTSCNEFRCLWWLAGTAVQHYVLVIGDTMYCKHRMQCLHHASAHCSQHAPALQSKNLYNVRCHASHELVNACDQCQSALLEWIVVALGTKAPQIPQQHASSVAACQLLYPHVIWLPQAKWRRLNKCLQHDSASTRCG
jgi:hypothetical protein